MFNLEIMFGLVSIISLFFAIYQHFSSKAKGTTEEAKIKMQIERIRHVKYSIITAAETNNMIVQRSKDESVNLQELSNLSRVARGQLIMIIRELENEEEKLQNWKYGMLYSSITKAKESTENKS